jgi:hypothetical protein
MALTCSQIEIVPDTDVKSLLSCALNHYDIMMEGKVYGTSPDSWCPFEDGESIIKYLHDANLKITSLSNLLAKKEELENWWALIREVDFYIFDPLFFMLGQKEQALAREIQSAIINGNQAYCITVPERLPLKLREKLIDVCEKSLPLLKIESVRNGRGVWPAENLDRFKAYLARLPKEIGQGPRQENLELVAKMMFEYFSGSAVDVRRMPRMIAG